MANLDNGWIGLKEKTEQAQLQIYNTLVEYSTTGVSADDDKTLMESSRKKVKDDKIDNVEGGGEEVLSKLNMISDIEDGIFNLTKLFILHVEDRSVQQEKHKLQLQGEQRSQLSQVQPSSQPSFSSLPIPVIEGSQSLGSPTEVSESLHNTNYNLQGGNISNIKCEFGVDLEPLYSFKSTENTFENQSPSSIEYPVSQSFTENSFPLQEGGQTNQLSTSSNLLNTWDGSIFNNWCSSFDTLVGDTSQQEQNEHLTHQLVRNPSDSQQACVQSYDQQTQQVQIQIIPTKIAPISFMGSSSQNSGRVYKTTKPCSSGTLTNDGFKALSSLKMPYRSPKHIGDTDRLLRNGCFADSRGVSSTSTNAKFSRKNISNSSVVGENSNLDDFSSTCGPFSGHDSIPILCEIDNIDRDFSESNGDLNPHVRQNSSVYKYVAQAQLSMQCDTTKLEIENKVEWLSLSPMTPERASFIISRLKEKNLSLDTAYEVFELFPQQKYLPLKLEILAIEFESHFKKLRSPGETSALIAEDAFSLNKWLWLNQRKKRSFGQLKRFPRFTARSCEIGNEQSYQIEVRTSSGYSDFTSGSESLTHVDFFLLRLRHMNLLRESDDRKRKTKYYEFIEGKMKRPLNSFMLYRSSLMKALSILKVVKVVTDLVKAVKKELPEFGEKEILDLLLETVKYRKDMTYHNSIYIKILSRIIDCELYNYCDSKPGNISYISQVTSESPIPIDPKFNNHTVLAQVITLMWNSEFDHYREGFVRFSKVEKNHHRSVYPKYRYCPVKKLKLGELKHNLINTPMSADLLDGFKNISSIGSIGIK